MVPSVQDAKSMWDKYALPEVKRNHCIWVSRLAVWLSSALHKQDPSIEVNQPLLEVAALLHDIDNAIPKLPGERHPDTGVRILHENQYGEVADLVKTHPLHAILDQTLAPKTWEEKILYLSDKMVKHTIITVDERFRLWKSESLPRSAVQELDEAYPRVKALEQEVCIVLRVRPEDIVLLASQAEMSTMSSNPSRRTL